MKTNLRLLIPICFLLATSIAEGHLLWASYADCVAVLGQPESREPSTRPATEAYAFRKGNWGMIINFWRGKAHLIACSKLDGTPLTQTEIRATLDGLADGNSWTINTQGETIRSDRRIIASTHGPGLVIGSAEFLNTASAIDLLNP